jgi:protein-disulfide isomerase
LARWASREGNVRLTLERLTNITLSIAAVAIAVSLGHREFSSPDSKGKPKAPALVREWNTFVESGISVGDRNSRVTILEFMDVQCPFCKKWHATTQKLRQTLNDSIRVTLVHLPLDIHPHAMDGAQALECANEQSRFEQYVASLFGKQDSLGIKSWVAFAQDADISDTTRFKRCMSSGVSAQRVQMGLSLAKKLNVMATPTVIINGWRYFQPPSEDELVRVVRSLLAGESPFAPSGFTKWFGWLGLNS